jgi:hypothetical protein
VQKHFTAFTYHTRQDLVTHSVHFLFVLQMHHLLQDTNESDWDLHLQTNTHTYHRSVVNHTLFHTFSNSNDVLIFIRCLRRNLFKNSDVCYFNILSHQLFDAHKRYFKINTRTFYIDRLCR